MKLKRFLSNLFWLMGFFSLLACLMAEIKYSFIDKSIDPAELAMIIIFLTFGAIFVTLGRKLEENKEKQPLIGNEKKGGKDKAVVV